MKTIIKDSLTQLVPLNKIKIGKNSRASVSPDELSGLMQAIKSQGQLQAIGLVKLKGSNGYEIAYGNRRFLAKSKLGHSTIEAKIYDNATEAERDLMNLTENIQRRNISLAEAGRYVSELKTKGLTNMEIAVRMGTSASYVDQCYKAFNEVPKEFRNDLELKVSNEKMTPGKISMKTAKAILNSKRTFRLTDEQIKPLFKAAKGDDRFTEQNVPKYAAAIKHGHKDFLGKVKPIKHIRLQFTISEAHHAELMKKFVEDGIFNSFGAFLVAVLRGEKHAKIDIKGRY